MAVKHSEIHILPLSSLKEGIHTFEYEVTYALWESFGQEIVSDASANIHVTLRKGTQMLQLVMLAKGWLEIECDRTLKKFKHNFQFEQELVYKFGDQYQELTDTVLVIERGTEILELNQIFYDYLMLQVPMRKVHPDVIDQEGEWIYRDSTQTEEQTTDPRWSKLKELSKTVNQE
jgi:uncharacterized metal-binding protein YceD (DUF177 family)